jgi:benzodiazapine receptor
MTRFLPVQPIKLVASLVLCLLAGFVGSIATTPKIDGWYASLNKPSFSPPNWIFAPVWTFLFVLMGIALYLVWKKGLAAKGVKVALAVFFLQLVLNMLWSFAFFGAQSPLAGLVVIFVLWMAIAGTMALFAPLSRGAALLLLPYILWVSFAEILNMRIYFLNR